jgi:hypothetical protein
MRHLISQIPPGSTAWSATTTQANTAKSPQNAGRRKKAWTWSKSLSLSVSQRAQIAGHAIGVAEAVMRSNMETLTGH